MRPLWRNLNIIVLSIFLCKTHNCWRLSSKEMKSILHQLNISYGLKTDEINTIEGKRYPEVGVYFFVCNSNLNKPTDFAVPEYCNPVGNYRGMDFLTRMLILHHMNRYRLKVAKGFCARCGGKRQLVLELRWNVDLEMDILKTIRTCPNQTLIKLNEPITYQGKSALSDTIIAIFPTTNGLKEEMKDEVAGFLSNNIFKDWDPDKYNATVTTTDGNLIKNGYAALMICKFLTIIANTSDTHVIQSIPTNENCRKFAPQFQYDVDPVNVYPELCKIKLTNIKEAQLPCKDPGSLGYLDFLDFYIYVDMKRNLISSRLPAPLPPPLPDPDSVNVNCTYRYQQKLSGIRDNSCPGVNCDESSLTEYAKFFVLKKLNTNREIVARGGCDPKCKFNCVFCTGKTYCNIKKLEWHWFLEQKANEIVNRCPQNNTRGVLYDDEGPFDDPIYYEAVTGIINLPRLKGQLALGDVVEWLFWKNFFFDWNESYEFKTGSTSYIGCTIGLKLSAPSHDVPKAFRLKNGIFTHIVCVFASIYTTFNSKFGKPEKNCCEKREKFLPELKNFGEYKYLCSVNSLNIHMGCGAECTANWTAAWNFSDFNGRIITENPHMVAMRNFTKNIVTTSFTRSTTPSIDVLYPDADVPNFPKIVIIPDPYEMKYCMIFLTFWFLLVALIILAVTLMVKYKFEKEHFFKMNIKYKMVK